MYIHKIVAVIFGLLCSSIGAAIVYYSATPKTVVVEVEKVVTIPIAAMTVTPDSDLVAQKTTYRITYEEFVVEYLEAESVVADENLIYFCDGSGVPIKILPSWRLWKVVRFDIGDRWDSRGL